MLFVISAYALVTTIRIIRDNKSLGLILESGLYVHFIHWRPLLPQVRLTGLQRVTVLIYLWFTLLFHFKKIFLDLQGGESNTADGFGLEEG